VLKMVKILIMDGEQSFRNLLYNMLRPLGHSMTAVEDGAHAIKEAQLEIPDIALLEMQVSDMETAEVFVKLKRINPDMKCIVISGFADEEAIQAVMALGAYAIISKPYKITEVHKAVQLAMKGQAPGAVLPPDDEPTALPVYHPPARKTEAPGSAATTASVYMPLNRPRGARSLLMLKVIAGIAVTVAAAGLFLFPGVAGIKPAIKEYPLSYANPMGMCFARSNLWISDWMSGNIYRHRDIARLSETMVYKTDNQHPTGLAFDGDNVWTCNSAEKRIYRHRLDDALSILSVYALPKVSPQGIYFDGVNIWVIDSEAAKLYKHKMDETLSAIEVFNSPAVNTCGMFRDGDFFYIGDYMTGKIYKASIKDLTVSEIFELPGFEKGKDKLAGIAWDGAYMWVCYDAVPKVFRHSLKSLKKVKL